MFLYSLSFLAQSFPLELHVHSPCSWAHARPHSLLAPAILPAHARIACSRLPSPGAWLMRETRRQKCIQFGKAELPVRLILSGQVHLTGIQNCL
jgi:hypothetical protein